MVLLPSLANEAKKSISNRTAQQWLYLLGYCQKRHTQGIYWDGHERKDVKAQRTEYLAEMAQLEK